MTLARLIAALNSHRVGAINLTRESWLALKAELMADCTVGTSPAEKATQHYGPLYVAIVLGHPVHLSDRDSLSVWNGASDGEVEIP